MEGDYNDQGLQNLKGKKKVLTRGGNLNVAGSFNNRDGNARSGEQLSFECGGGRGHRSLTPLGDRGGRRGNRPLTPSGPRGGGRGHRPLTPSGAGGIYSPQIVFDMQQDLNLLVKNNASDFSGKKNHAFTLKTRNLNQTIDPKPLSVIQTNTLNHFEYQKTYQKRKADDQELEQVVLKKKAPLSNAKFSGEFSDNDDYEQVYESDELRNNYDNKSYYDEDELSSQYTGNKEYSGKTNNPIDDKSILVDEEVPAEMENAPPWATCIWIRMVQLEKVVKKNMTMVQQQARKLFDRSEHLPELMPFEYLDDFIAFETSSDEDYNTLVGYLLNLGKTSIRDCAHEFIKASFSKHEYVTPHVTTKGAAAMTMSRKFPKPSMAAFVDEMDKSLTAAKHRRGALVTKGVLEAETQGQPKQRPCSE